MHTHSKLYNKPCKLINPTLLKTFKIYTLQLLSIKNSVTSFVLARLVHLVPCFFSTSPDTLARPVVMVTPSLEIVLRMDRGPWFVLDTNVNSGLVVLTYSPVLESTASCDVRAAKVTRLKCLLIK